MSADENPVELYKCTRGTLPGQCMCDDCLRAYALDLAFDGLETLTPTSAKPSQ